LYQSVLLDARFFELLRLMDQDLAEAARGAGCRCGGTLHAARYRRKPRGGPEGLGPEHSVRESFCCSVEGCRRRTTPASVRFLGRRVFFSVVVLLVPILREGLTPQRFERLAEELPLSRRTLGRWRRWWLETYPATTRGRQGVAEIPGLQLAHLPSSLLAAFGCGRDAVLRALCWLAPQGLKDHGR